MKDLELLLHACQAGASDVALEMLLKDSGLVAVESEGKKRTPLLIAARAGRHDIVQCVHNLFDGWIDWRAHDTRYSIDRIILN